MLMTIKVELDDTLIEIDIFRKARPGCFELEDVWYKTSKKVFEELRQEGLLFTKQWPKELELYLVDQRRFYLRTVPQTGDYGVRRWLKPQLIAGNVYVRSLPKLTPQGQYVFMGRLRDRKIVACVEGPLRERVKDFANQYGCTFEAPPEVGRAVGFTTSSATWARTTAY